MEIKNIYNQLTSVNIDEQKQLWDERGKGYYGEFLVFKELYEHIPGRCKILMNLNIPTDKGKTTEIDLLLIHETGIYVFEVKHYKGTIYGKDTDNIWTQYFRTTKNSTFKNPMLQNNYHIDALKKMFPTIPVNSIIVFTSNECNLKITNSNPNIDVCELYNINKTLGYRLNSKNIYYNMDEIDYLFNKLSEYSQMKEVISINGKEKTFIEWLEPALAMFEAKKMELDNEKYNWLLKQKKAKTNMVIGIIINIIIAMFCLFFSSHLVTNAKNNYELELSKFKQNFLHVDEIGNEYIDMLNDFVDVSNVSLIELSDNIVSFTARLSMNNDVYGIQLNENSKYIVMTNNKTYEYDVFGEHLKYAPYSNKIGKGIKNYGDLSKAQFFGVNKNDITYIKMTNITLFKIDFSRTVIKDNLELELYKK